MPSTPIPRREFLTSGLTLAGATLLGTTGIGCAPDRITAPATPEVDEPRAARATDDLPEPTVLRSDAGVLTAAIVCATRPVTAGGRHVAQPVSYNGSLPGPTLWVRPGDTIDLTFTNRIVHDQADEHPGYGRPPRETHMTNLHFHGMHVSPVGSADNMLVMVPPHGTHRYLFEVPADHPAGLFWYHAHVHGLVTNHVSRGAAGMIYVANAWTDQLATLGIRHRLMMLQQAYFDEDRRTLISDDGERDNPDLALSLINGALLPEIRLRPGEPQVWSLVNASSSAFYLLRLEGHTFDVIAEDGTPLRAPRLNQSSLLMSSAKRLEVIVRGTATAGRYALAYDAYDQGVDTWPARTVGTVVVGGPAWTGADVPGVDTTVALEDLSLADVPSERRRTIVFAQDDTVAEGEFGRFTMNGHAYDPGYNEWTSTLGTVEEWHIVNQTTQDHPFHVHVNMLQVTHVNGQAVAFDGYQDTAIVPRFGSITVRTRFTDFTGWPILMHCHILDHEDMGMMTSFTIVAPTQV